MADLIQEAKDLIQRAHDQGRCRALAKSVERRLEDLKDAASAGNWAIGTGAVLVVVGPSAVS
jgi:hypothetical protein